MFNTERMEENYRQLQLSEKYDCAPELLNLLRDLIDAATQRWEVTVPVQRLNPNVKLPLYANPTDAGCDIFVQESFSLAPGEQMIIKTGLAFAIPDGWQFEIRPKSGLSAKTKLRIANSPGTIDTGYRDELGVIVDNTDTKKSTGFLAGDKIAQIVLTRTAKIKWQEVDNVKDIGEDRGGGFGSTGR